MIGHITKASPDTSSRFLDFPAFRTIRNKLLLKNKLPDPRCVVRTIENGLRQCIIQVRHAMFMTQIKVD
jgi:hypothetical protein